jgi:hypothetical protein
MKIPLATKNNYLNYQIDINKCYNIYEQYSTRDICIGKRKDIVFCTERKCTNCDRY